MRMESICLMTGNGRSSLPKVGWWSTSQPQKQEGKSTHENLNSMYICKSATRVGRCKWPLVVCIRRFPKEQMAGFLAMDYHTVARRSLQRSFATTVGSEEKAMKLSEEYTDISNGASSDLPRNYFGQPVDRTELESMRVDDIRAKLIRKLSEANQHNRHLKRQLHDKEQTLNKYKNELAVMELELQALITLAEEVARYGIKDGSRKINGRYIHSHLALRLEEFHEKLLQQIKGVDGMQFREVALVWYGMAEEPSKQRNHIFLIVFGLFNMLSKMNSSLFLGFTRRKSVLKDSSKVPRVPRDSTLRLASISPNGEGSSP